MKRLPRRQFLTGIASLTGLGLTGCATPEYSFRRPAAELAPGSPSTPPTQYARIYGPLPNEQFPIDAIDLSRVPEQFYRTQIPFRSRETPGTIIVDTSNFYLYLVQEGGTAMRYGVGLGRAGFGWSGRAEVAWKRKWPTWTPPDEMIERQPELEKYSADNGGMEPGLDNPLGARALYIFQDGVDTLYRIHGTPEYWTIGKAVSSGCVRMIQHDVIDLYDRVPSGSPILVTGGATS